jgi:polyketide biosynthesis acyl carrier protein
MSQPVDAAAGPGVRTLVEQVVREILPALRDRRIPGDKHLKELGADSVDRVEIIMTLIERLGLDEGMSGFAALPDVDALVGYLADRTAGR